MACALCVCSATVSTEVTTEVIVGKNYKENATLLIHCAQMEYRHCSLHYKVFSSRQIRCYDRWESYLWVWIICRVEAWGLEVRGPRKDAMRVPVVTGQNDPGHTLPDGARRANGQTAQFVPQSWLLPWRPSVKQRQDGASYENCHFTWSLKNSISYEISYILWPLSLLSIT